MKQSSTLTLDQFFKKECLYFFPFLGFDVQTELELITGPKRIDVVLLRKLKRSNTKHLQTFNYFSKHNLISYKSFKDSFRMRDINDCFIYYHSYIQSVEGANRNNTTITLLISRKPRKFLGEYKAEVKELGSGIYTIQNTGIHLRVINVEEAELKGEDGAFLSLFCEKMEGFNNVQKKTDRSSSKAKKLLAKLRKVLRDRLHYFGGESPMGTVADITDIVLPKLEEAVNRGIKKGRLEGMETGIKKGRLEGIEKGKIENAKTMLRKGYSLTDIIEITGLTEEQLEGVGINGKTAM